MTQANAGLIVKPSALSVAETLDKLETILNAKGVKNFARIDHAAAAKESGLDMPATQVLVFGNPQMGTPLMAATPTLAIDLPLKVLAWDENGQTQVAFTDPATLAERHGNQMNEVFGKMRGILDALTDAATSSEG